MTWHPLVAAIWLVDCTAGLIYLGAAWRLMTALAHWQPAGSDAQQLWRERALDLAAFQGHWTMALQALAFVLILAGISNVWTAYVPGAMCGTGVLQAMGPAGRQTLLLRGAALLIFYCWLTAERMNHADPESVPAAFHGRLLLLAAPFMALAAWRFGSAVATTTQAPVSCCAALYDPVRISGGVGPMTASIFPARTWMALTFGGALLVGLGGWRQWKRPYMAGTARVVLLVVWTGLWVPAAVMGLKLGVAPYVFQILYHPCPWCLFLAEHGAIGVVLFGLPAWVVAESAAGLTAQLMARRHPRATAPALARMRRAGLRICIGAWLFFLVAAAPILWWRLRSGGWMF